MEASELCGICAELASQPPSADASRRLQEVIVLSAAEGCRQQGGAFGNLFSQIDFLSKKLGLSARLTREVQTARRHSNGDGAIAADDWPYDLMAAARFVSAVFHQDVPAQVLRLLPVDSRQQQPGLHIDKQYIRCIVSEVGDALVTADTDDGPITIDYRNTQQGRDFAYLQKLLRPGMQLNLLDCSLSEDDNIIVPGQDLYGKLPGFLGKERNSFCWVITSCKVKNEQEAEMQLINDYGSEDLSATLTRKNDSIYVLRQGAGSTLKVPHDGKWRKLPKTLELKRR